MTVSELAWTNPPADGEFRRAATEAIPRGANTVATLGAALRGRYPRVVVTVRDLSGETPAFYAYRDGHWTSSRSIWDRSPWQGVLAGPVREADPAAESEGGRRGGFAEAVPAPPERGRLAAYAGRAIRASLRASPSTPGQPRSPSHRSR